MSKPWVFNYDHFRELEQKYADLLIKHVHLQAENTNLKIKCRILEADLKALQKEEQKMTREEAIRVLKDTYAHWLRLKDEDILPCSECEKVTEAIDMAIEALSAEHKHCWDCKHYEPKYNVCHAPEVVKQVTSKLNNPCDSLLTDDSAECKEQKSKLEHDREWIIGCIKHDGFIKTDRFDKANQIILDALSADAETKCIAQIKVDTEEIVRRIKEEYDITDGWIPCSERLPDDLAEVNVTWVNHDPEPYYDFVKDKPASASAVFYKGKWFWYSSVCIDILAEYGENDIDEVDNAIEILAWMPLPQPYGTKMKGGAE